jgi:RNA polymerase sigma-70 factor, ECF subfamily
MSGIHPGPDGASGDRPQDRPEEEERTRLASLIRDSARGDEAAFAQLYDATSARMYGLALRVVRDPAQAEEVTQEVFVEIWRQCARYDRTTGSPLAWMMTIGHRRAVDRVRSAEASRRRDTAYGRSHREVAHDQTAESATTHLEARRMRAALRSLTDAQRRAIELAYFGGYTHAEVAGLLDLPLGTAKTRIRDGLIRLRDTMGVES